MLPAPRPWGRCPRWLRLPLYLGLVVLGLVVAQGVYAFLFLKELWHLVRTAPSLSEQSIMLIVRGLIDVMMISNLLVMVIVGGYETFVSRLNLQGLGIAWTGRGVAIGAAEVHVLRVPGVE